MKPQEKILTYAQAKELKWFCDNVTGTRQEFYEALDTVNKLAQKLNRLEKTGDLIRDFFDKNPIKTEHKPKAGE